MGARPCTYLGLRSAGFPNMLTLVGPHNAATEQAWTAHVHESAERLLLLQVDSWMSDKGYTRIEPTEAARGSAPIRLGIWQVMSKRGAWCFGGNCELPRSTLSCGGGWCRPVRMLSGSASSNSVRD